MITFPHVRSWGYGQRRVQSGLATQAQPGTEKSIIDNLSLTPGLPTAGGTEQNGMGTTGSQVDGPRPTLRWYQYRLRTLLAAFVVFAMLFGWLSGRIRIQRPWDEEPSCIADIGTVRVYQWQPSHPVTSYRVMVDGKKNANGECPPTDFLQLAVVDDDERIQVQIRVDGASQRVDVLRPKSPRSGTASAFPLRSLKVKGPTTIYERAETGSDSSGSAFKIEVIVE